MGFDNDCIVNIQSLAGEYFCAVCRTLVYPNEAVQAPCTHLYCKPCLTYTASTTHACPYDGYMVTEADSKPLLESNKTLAETIGKIKVRCLYYRTGCVWEGSISDSTSHCSTCSFGESAVLCNRCGIQLKHRQVLEHAQNCSVVQSQAQQSGGVQNSTSTGAATASHQTQTAVQTGGSVPQATSSQAPTLAVPSQDANPTANLATSTQPQVTAQVTMLTPEQMYQQQQLQYQQYYQQYPGYDPYQQNYQYYYQYPQVAQQYQQPQAQAYPQAYGQPQPQVYGQTQPVVQGQQPVLPQAPPQGAQPPSHPQAPPQGAQPPSHPQAQTQTAGNGQPLVPPTGQAQPQIPVHGQAQPQMGQAQGQAPIPHAPFNQPQPLPQVQPYTQPQPAPQQQLQVPQYPHTHPQMQHPPAQNYPQPQTQHYPHPQPQVHSQPHSQPSMQAPVHPPQQPFPHSAQPQTPNTASGYQSYPQPQLHPQAQAGAPQPAPYSNQGQYPVQTQMRPPQSYPNGPAQGQPPSGPSVYPQAQAQQHGYPFQQRPNMQASQQAAPQQYGQQQSFPGSPFMQHQPSMPAQLHSQGPSQMPPQSQQNYGQPPNAQPNVAHNYAGRPLGLQAASHPYGQAAGNAGAGQTRPAQSNQSYPMKTNNQLSSGQTQRVSSGENSRDPIFEKGVRDHDNTSKDARDMTSNPGNRRDEIKLKAKNNSAVSADGGSYVSGSKQMPDGETKVENHVQEAKPMITGDAGEGGSKTPGDASKSGGEDHGDAVRKAEVQELKNTPKHVSGSSAPPSDLRKPHVQSQLHGVNSYPSTDHGRNQLQPMTHGQHKPDNYSNQFRPQGPGQAPSSGMPFENPSGGIHGPGSSGSLGRPSNVNYYQDNHPPRKAGHPQNPSGDSVVGPTVTAHRPGASRYENDKFEAQRSGHFDGRQPDPHPHGPLERNSFGPGPHGVQPGAMKYGGPSVHDPTPAPRMLDERGMPFGDEHLKHLPPREFEDDFRKFTRPPHLEAGPSSNYGTLFPSSGPLDHGSRMLGGDGMLRPFDKGPHGFDRDIAFKMDGGVPSRLLPPFHSKDGERARAFLDDDLRRAEFNRPDFSGPPPGPGFGRHHMDGLPPRSPGRDYPGFHPRTVGPYGDVGGNEGRFPPPPRGGHDMRANLLLGEPLAQNHDLMPSHLRRGGHMGPRGLRLGEESMFGRPEGLSRIEPPLGNFPPHVPFGDSFGGERPGHLLQGEPGFRNRYGFPHHGHDDGFHPRETDPFENLRKRKPGSIMCRICQVECGTVEGLDLHSQSREHQRKARDMVLSIKQQNKKKQKVSKDQASVEEGRGGGRPKNLGFQGRGNKR